MRITAGILFFFLNNFANAQHICHSADRMELLRTGHLCRSEETEPGVLYLEEEPDGVLLFCCERKLPAAGAPAKAHTEAGEKAGISSLWIPCRDPRGGGDTRDGGDSKREEQKGLPALMDIYEAVTHAWNTFERIQREILEKILMQEPAEAVFDRMRELLPVPFVIVDRDMLLLYRHPAVDSIMRSEIGDNYTEEIIEELFHAKEFHDVAKRREPFYYYMENLEFRQYCINILAEGIYYARFVVYLEKGELQLPSGAEQIAEYIAGILVQMILRGLLKAVRSQDDPMHRSCLDILNGRKIMDRELRNAILRYGWEEGQDLQVICLEPYSTTGWETQLENTMPFMVRKLEQSYRQSCAVFSGKQILWLVNRSLFGKESGQSDFLQQFSLQLRENIFRAGLSDVFRECALMPAAFREAQAALALGTAEDPSHWYYHFGHHRLNYMLNTVRESGIDAGLLVHPAIRTLREYDLGHESRLAETLKMFTEQRGNLTKTADALYIHRTTLFRRLNQIKKLTKLEPEDPDLMLELQLSYRIMEN